MVDVVAGKIRRLAQDVQSALKVAACLGSTFDAGMIESIVSHVEQRVRDEQAESDICKSIVELKRMDKQGGVIQLLDTAVEEDLLMEINTSKYKFAHDRIHQAAYSLLPEGNERDLLHLWIGELLWQIHSSTDGEDWMLFVAADQLDRGSAFVTERKRKIELARLNLAAGERAISLSAFVPAASYLTAGISLLDQENTWVEYYNLTLNLYNTSAEMALCNGDSVHCRELVDAVLTHARCLRDKLRVYFTLLELLSGQQQFVEAMDTGFSVLAELGEHFPKRPHLLQAVFDMKKTQRMLRGLSDEELVAHPVMEDENKSAAMKLMSSLARHAYFLHRRKHFALISLRMVQLSLSFGMDNLSPVSFAAFGLCICNMYGDLKEGYRFGRLALKLSENLSGEHWGAQVSVVVHLFLSHWQAPIQDSLEPLLSGYQNGMQSGNIEWAFFCAGAYAENYLYSGLQLEPVERDIRSFSKQMVEYSQGTTAMINVLHWQFILNLMGRSADPLQLTGEAMVQETALQRIVETNNNVAMRVFWLLRIQLAYYFGDMDLALKILKSSNINYIKVHLFFYVWTFFSGLVSLELARTTRRRRHRVRARKVINVMKKWVSAGAVNSVHKLQLLKAEYKALNGKDHDSVRHSYDAAISMASKAGFLQDSALANERAGLFFLQHGDEFWASVYLTRAHELYCEWGAQAKAGQIVSQHSAVFKPSLPTRYTSRHKSRSRFSNKSSLRHKQLRLSGSVGSQGDASARKS